MPTFDATTLLRNPTYNGAVSTSGLTSLLGTNPTQIAAKKAAEEAAKAGAAKFGLGTLMQGLGPLYAAYSVLDLLGFFDSTLQETPMTPEERAELEATSRLALAQSGMQEGGEGAYETLMDAVGQAAQTGLLSNKDIGVSGNGTTLKPVKSYPTLTLKLERVWVHCFLLFIQTQCKPLVAAGAVGTRQRVVKRVVKRVVRLVVKRIVVLREPTKAILET